MAREIEKPLLAELERALKDQDRLDADLVAAKDAFHEASTKMGKANDEVKALAGAVATLRGKPGREHDVVKEVRDTMEKEQPVA